MIQFDTDNVRMYVSNENVTKFITIPYLIKRYEKVYLRHNENNFLINRTKRYYILRKSSFRKLT